MLPGEEAVRNFRKGQDRKPVVLGIDMERERISLGIKQLEGDPFNSFVGTHEKGSIVKGTVKSLDAKGAVIDLGAEMEGYLRASEVSRDRVEDMRTHLKEGDAGRGHGDQCGSQEPPDQPLHQGQGQRRTGCRDEEVFSAESSAAASGATNLGALLKAKLDNKGGDQQ